MRMRNVPKFRKVPKGLGRHEPLKHADHPKPTTRRQFLAQGFMSGTASVLLPSGLSMLIGPRAAKAQAGCTAPSGLACDIQTAVTACGITSGAGMIPFICFDLSGGGNIAGSNVLIGGPGGQLDFLSVAGYSKLGLPGTMVPNSSTTSFVDSSLGLRYHSDSAHLRGIKTRFSNPTFMAKVTGTVIPALSQNDTNTNPHNPMYGIYQAGARGALLNLIGTDSSTSGGNSMAPAGMVNISAQPTVIDSGQDTAGLVSTGQLGTLLPNSSDVTNVLESMKRISDPKYGVVTAYSSATPASAGTGGMTGTQLNANALGPTGTQACAFTKSAYLLNKYPNPGAVDPDDDTTIVGAANSIFTAAEYQQNSDFQMTAAVMKLVIDGDAAAGTIQLGGFDYHTGERATGEGRDFDAGSCIGAVLQYAALKGKPVMIYVFSDGSLASDGTIDTSVGGPRQGRVDGGQPERGRHLLAHLQPGRQGGDRAKQRRDEPAARLDESGRLAGHQLEPRRQQRAEPRADGGAQLHGAALDRGGRQLAEPVADHTHQQHARCRCRDARSAHHVPAARGTRRRQSPGLIASMLGSGRGAGPGLEPPSMCVRAHCLNRETVHARGNSPREIPAGRRRRATVRRQRERRKADRRAPMISRECAPRHTRSPESTGSRVDTAARIMRFCIRSDQGKLVARRGRKASGLVPWNLNLDSGVTSVIDTGPRIGAGVLLDISRTLG